MNKRSTEKSRVSDNISASIRYGNDLPPTKSIHPKNSDHFVQFYESDDFLVNSLTNFISEGLDAGDVCLIVATKDHRESLVAQLESTGINLKQAQTRGQYISLDAAEICSSFMSDGFPVEHRFMDVVGSIIERSALKGRRIRIFGEMVALLVCENNVDAAVEVEKLWNKLNRIYPFTLFCAYPLKSFSGEAYSDAFRLVCNGHSAVIPAESYTNLHDPDKQFRAISLLQQRAVSLEAEIVERKKVEENLISVKEELENQVTDMRQLHKMSVSLVGTLDLKSLLNKVLRAALTVQKTNMGLLSLIDTESGGLRLKVQQGFSKKIVKQIEFIAPGIGACGICLNERRQIIVEDVETDPIFESLREVAKFAGFAACHSTPLIDRLGNIIGVLSVHFSEPHTPSQSEMWLMDLYARMAADIIENARLHQQVWQELEQSEKLLLSEQLARTETEKASRLKDEFLATVSHELRTPLNAIIGWSKLLRKDNIDERLRNRAIETIDRSAHSQAQLIEDLLDVSRIITGKLKLNIAPVEVASVINSAIDSVQLAADSKEIKLDVEIDNAVGKIMGDASRLQQIIWNLLSNAIKFTAIGGLVHVCLRIDGKYLVVEISDTGQGINAEFLPFIFDRFRQADATSTRQHGGLGLGLAIVRQLVELHGGSVSAQSFGKDCGATFTIKFPLVAKQAHLNKNGKHLKDVGSKRQLSNSVKLHKSLKGLKILLVDDNIDALQILEILLSEFNFQIQTADSVEKALDVFGWFEPEILISDLAMPHDDGFSLIKQIRSIEDSNENKLPAIALTAYSKTEDRNAALASGFDRFLSKPLEIDELLKSITKLVTVKDP